jgi:hypothetical protein
MNLQYIFSYLGLIPYLIIILDKAFYNQLQINIINDFYVYYSLFIIIFIGSMNWNLKNNVPNFQVFYGFVPSIFSLVILILNLYSYSYFLIIYLLVIFILLQLIIDYSFLYSSKNYRKIFYKLRLPLSILICLCLITNLILF